MTHQMRIAADPVVELQWSKSSEQHGLTKHRRGPSTARTERFVTRSICGGAALRMTSLWENERNGDLCAEAGRLRFLGLPLGMTSGGW